MMTGCPDYLLGKGKILRVRAIAAVPPTFGEGSPPPGFMGLR